MRSAAAKQVELAGEDPGRRLVALPIGGPALAGITQMKPLWTAPFGGYSFELLPTAGAVVGMPTDGVQAAWDLATGALLWERPQVEGELLGILRSAAGPQFEVGQRNRRIPG